MKDRYYVAYGSNLNIGQMKMRCPGAKVVGTGMINGYELLFKGSYSGAYLTIEKKKGGKVPIAIWKVTKLDEINLDRYEGYPTFYYKTMVMIDDGDKEIEAFVYIMHEDRKLGLPSNAYIDTCLEGYKSFNFEKKYIINAIKRSSNG